MKTFHSHMWPNCERMLPLFSILLCLLLLSACGSSNAPTQANNTSSTPMTKVNPTLREQVHSQLATFKEWIAVMKQFGGDIAQYQQQYDQDEQQIQKATTDQDYASVLKSLDEHVQAIQLPALKTEFNAMHKDFTEKVKAWRDTHVFHNPYDNVDYHLGYEYGPEGIEQIIADEMKTAKTVADYNTAIFFMQTYRDNFEAMKTNFEDKTPSNQPHQADLDLIKKYGKGDTRALVISFLEQTLRVYEKGNLVKVIPITTGQPALPSLPGKWWVQSRVLDTVFKAEGTPETNPYWYGPTKINVAMQYHSGGYFLHDSWWRTEYGKGSNYPHPADATGASRGSHGCVNMSTADARWVYDWVQLFTAVIMY